MAYNILLCWEIFLTVVIVTIASTLIYQLLTKKSKMNPFFVRMSLAVIFFGFASVSMDLTHIIINIVAQQPILNLFYPSIYIVFNLADGLWMAETLLLYLLYFGRVYITFKPSEEFALGSKITVIFAILVILNFSANVCYFMTSFGVIQLPVIWNSIRKGAADMFLMTTILDFMVNSLLLTLFLSKLKVIQRRSNKVVYGRKNMLTAMTKVTVLGIVAMVSTQLIYIYALIMFFHIGEVDVSYQLFYAFRGGNILLDVVAVYCNLGDYGGGLYRCLFRGCDHCVYHCCEKVTTAERMQRGIELKSKRRVHPVQDQSGDLDFEDSPSSGSASTFDMR